MWGLVSRVRVQGVGLVVWGEWVRGEGSGFRNQGGVSVFCFIGVRVEG